MPIGCEGASYGRGISSGARRGPSGKIRKKKTREKKLAKINGNSGHGKPSSAKSPRWARKLRTGVITRTAKKKMRGPKREIGGGKKTRRRRRRYLMRRESY